MHSGQLTEPIDILRQRDEDNDYGANRPAGWRTVCRTRAHITRRYPGIADDTGEVFQQVMGTFVCQYYVCHKVQAHDHICTIRGRWRILGVETDHDRSRCIIQAELINP